MSATLALRHQERRVDGTRPWLASRLADEARLGRPTLRQVRRAVDDPGSGTVIEASGSEAHPLHVVVRLWLGVLAIFGLIVFAGLVLIILGAWAFGFRPVVVTSGSMEPSVRTGDVVITRHIGMDDKVGTQTVINFEDPVTTEEHIHRVVEVTDAGYRTKGDANQTPDAALVPQDHVDGAGVMLAPYVGYLPLWIQQRAWAPLGVCTAILLALFLLSRRRWMWGAERR
jgi:signal peptidase